MGVLRKAWNSVVTYPIVSGQSVSIAYIAHAILSGKVTRHIEQYAPKLPKTNIELIEVIKPAIFMFQDYIIGAALAVPAVAMFEILKKYTYKTDYFTPLPLFGKSPKIKNKKIQIFSDRFVKPYLYLLRGINDSAKQGLEFAPKELNSYLALIEKCVKIGDEETACIISRNLADLAAQGIFDPEAGGLSGIEYMFKKKTLFNRVMTANLEMAQGSHDSAINHFIELSKEGLELKVLAATAMSSLAKLPNYSKKCAIKAAELWKESIEELAPQLSPQDRLGESKNLVYELKNSKFLGSTIIFKAKNSRDELSQEKAVTETLEEIVADEKRCFVPAPLHITEKQIKIGNESLYVYASMIERGQTLLQKINSGAQTKEDFCSIAGLLALIHAKFPAEKTYGRLSIATTLYFDKLRNNAFAVPACLQKEIIKNYRPVYDSIAAQNFVYNKDSHPENWLIDDNGNITILDCEKSWLVPQQFDLANLLDYGDYLSYDKKKQIILDFYLPAYRKEMNLPIDEKKFIAGYLNSVVHRSLALSSAWSSKDRQSLWPKRKALIDNAIDSIYNIAKEDPHYYGKYAVNYTKLAAALAKLSGHLKQSSTQKSQQALQ
jgi:thiamine kinase-like enzyme